MIWIKDIAWRRRTIRRVMEARYYSLIRRTPEGLLIGWVPDLPGVSASGETEDDVVRRLRLDARALLDRMTVKGLSHPAPSPSDALPLGDRLGLYRRLLLVLR